MNTEGPVWEQTTEVADYDRWQRAYDNASTLLAEMMHGSMRTRFEYQFDGKELYARDGGAVGPILDKAIEAADRLVAARPNLAFEARRRRVEKGEYHDMLSMMHGRLPNTMIVVSDFPPELADASENVGGYDVSRRQTMLRVLARGPDGRLEMYSQSLDGSDRPALEAVYRHFGLQPRPGELLGQRIHVQLDSGEQTLLVDRLMGVYDRQLQARYGGEWYAGQSGGQRVNTYDFVCRQHDLVALFMSADQDMPPTADGDVRYDIAAAMDARFRRNAANAGAVSMSGVALQLGVGMLNPDLRREIEQAGGQARAQHKSYSGCGVNLESSAGEQSADSQLSQAGYGNKTNPETVYKFDRKMYCNLCQAPPKKKEPKKWCGPCGLCRSCDKQLGGKG